jgi:histidinol-phosphate aminotransferase
VSGGPQPRPGILDIAAYVPGKAKVAGGGPVIKLSANENPLGCSAAAQAAYLTERDTLSRYPDPQATDLRSAVAARFGLEPSRLVFGCGSDELFNLVCQAYLGSGDNIVQPAHGFAAWAIAARAAGGEVRTAPEAALTVDVDAMLAAVDARTRIVFVANPANPTGTWLSPPEIARLHDGLPDDVILVLDEAYAEYGGSAPEFASGLPLAKASDKVFLTRTFSKAYGLAGLRVGWGYAPQEMAAAMERIRPPFNVTRPALAAAQAALDDTAFLDASLAHADRWRAIISRELSALGLDPTPSATNFVTFAVGPPTGWTAAGLEQALAGRGILVRGLAGYGLPDSLRVTVGTDAECRAFLATLAELMASGQSSTDADAGVRRT